MAEHPKTEAMRSMSNRYPLPRVVEEMLYMAADEIDRLRAAARGEGNAKPRGNPSGESDR